jgi:TRAP-type transport system small permease protein
MVSIVFANVVSRYFFSSSLNWVDELSRAVFVWLSFIGIVVVMWEKGHIGFGNIFSKLNPIIGKITLLIGVILQIIFIIYLFRGGLRLVSITLIQLTPYMAIPNGYIYAIVPAMAFLMLLITIRDLVAVFHQNKQEEEK